MAPQWEKLLQRAGDFAEACAQISSTSALGAALVETLAPFGFPSAASGRLGSSGRMESLHFAEWDPKWRDVYVSRGYMHFDPVPLWAASSGAPIDAGFLRAQAPRSHPAQEVFRAGDAFGLGGGFISPQRAADNHPGVVAFVGPRDPDSAVVRYVLSGLASIVFHRAEAIHHRGPSAALLSPQPALTIRERECLKHFVEGRTSAFAAKAMKVSEATIRFHTRNLCAKTGAANRAHLVAIAIVRGLVQSQVREAQTT